MKRKKAKEEVYRSKKNKTGKRKRKKNKRRKIDSDPPGFHEIQVDSESTRKIFQKTLRDNCRRMAEARKLIDKLEDKLKGNLEPNTSTKVQQLLAVWQTTLSEYLAEKSALESKLGISSEGVQEEAEEEQKSQDLWIKCLFGVNNDASLVPWPTCSLFSEFIAIRLSWDHYLSTDISSSSQIPKLFVLPPHETSENNPWNEFLDKN